MKGFAPLFALWLVGCSKDAEFLDFVKENDAMVAEVKKAETPEGAQQAFDAKKGALREKLLSCKKARSFQIKQESLAKVGESLTKGVTEICGLQLKGLLDRDKGEKYKKLCEDYTTLIKVD